MLAVGVLAACGSSSRSGNGVAAKTPSQILTASSGAIQSASSVHVSGQLSSGGQTIKLDLNIVSGKGAKGNMSQNGLSFQLIAVGSYVYINGSPDFWKHFGGTAAATLFQGKWLKAPSTTGSFASLSTLTNLKSLASGLLSSHGTLTKGSTSTVNGQKVIALKDTSKDSQLYVATTDKPYPIEIAKGSDHTQQISFDKYNASVSLSAPATSIDISKLQGK
ncbi:MAG: hypothetical protein ACR2NR_17380 [Solirubrobacteraceae bacterium]